MALVWDGEFRRWLEYYGGGAVGLSRLKEDFALAFKRLTELGFQATADQPPAYYEPSFMKARK